MMHSESMPKENEIFARLVPLLVEVLGVPPAAVRPESVLVHDLGAESIDLLDLSFRIEETFKVSIEANEIEKEARRRLPAGEYEKDGFLTSEALAELRALLPEVDPRQWSPGLRKTDLPSLLTVSFFVRLIARKLAGKAEDTARA